MNRSKLFASIVVVFANAMLTCGVQGNPNHRVLDAPLAIHGKVTVPAWHAEASKLYEDAAKKLLTYLEKERENAIKTINSEDLGKTHQMVTMVNRLGTWIEIWGEPAGGDFKMRAPIMHAHLERIANASLSFPGPQNYANGVRQSLAKNAPQRAKILSNIEKLCNEQKWEAAEAALFKFYDSIEPGIIFIGSSERAPIYEPFIKVDAAIREAMTSMRAAAASAELKKSITELTPNYNALLQEMNGAVDAVAASGNATWRGESATGPQLVGKIGQTWREIQVQVQQLRAKTWALSFRQFSPGGYHMTSPVANQTETDVIATQFSAFSQQVMKTMVRLIDVDATRVPADAARKLYLEYLSALAPIVRQTNDQAWGTQLESSLVKIAGKEPTLDRETKAYAAATSDLLRWRARVAAAQAATTATAFAPIAERFHAGTLSGKVDGADYVGLFAPPPSPDTQPQFLTDAPDIMPIAVKRLLGQKTTVRDVIRTAPDSKASIARYSTRTYATIPAPLPIGPAVEALKLDLMVSEQAPPLTLAATQAVVTAERGDMVAVGGEISGVHLEAVVTRFAALPVSAALLSPTGQIPLEKFDGQSLKNALMRFEITPRWAHHDYFFINLPPAANLTASR